MQFENDLTVGFSIYNNVKRLCELIRQVDSSIIEQFEIENYFYPFVKEWLGQTRKNLLEWIVRIVAVDDVRKSAKYSELFTLVDCG